MKITAILLCSILGIALGDAPVSSYAALPHETHHEPHHGGHVPNHEVHHQSSYGAPPQQQYGPPKTAYGPPKATYGPPKGGYRPSKGYNYRPSKGNKGFGLGKMISAPWKMMKGAGNYMRGFFGDMRNKWYEMQGSFLMSKGKFLSGIGKKYYQKSIGSKVRGKGNYKGSGGVVYGNSKPFTQGKGYGYGGKGGFNKAKGSGYHNQGHSFNNYHQGPAKGYPIKGQSYAAPQHAHHEVHVVSGHHDASHGHHGFGGPKSSDIYHATEQHAVHGHGQSELISQAYQQPIHLPDEQQYAGSAPEASVAVPETKHVENVPAPSAQFTPSQEIKHTQFTPPQNVQQRSARHHAVESDDVGRSYAVYNHVEHPIDRPIPVPFSFYVQPSSLLIPQTFNGDSSKGGYH